MLKPWAEKREEEKTPSVLLASALPCPLPRPAQPCPRGSTHRVQHRPTLWAPSILQNPTSSHKEPECLPPAFKGRCQIFKPFIVSIKSIHMSADAYTFQLFSKVYLNRHKAAIIPIHHTALTQDLTINLSALFIPKYKFSSHFLPNGSEHCTPPPTETRPTGFCSCKSKCWHKGPRKGLLFQPQWLRKS